MAVYGYLALFLIAAVPPDACAAAPCTLPRIRLQKLASFEQFKQHFENGQVKPAILEDVAHKWGSMSWTLADLLEHLGDVEVWPRQLRNQDHSTASRSLNSTVRQLLGDAASELAVFETNFCPVTRAMAGTYAVPKAFLSSYYASPVLGLSGRGTGVGFHTSNGKNAAAWIAQVYGSTKWVIKPPGVRAERAWPWPDVTESEGAISCTLERGEVLLVPSDYTRSWYGLGDANLVFGWQGSEVPSPDMGALLSTITAGDVAALQKVFTRLPENPPKHLYTASCVNHATHTGHVPVLRQLHRMGANLDQEDPSGSTFMHYAAMAGHADVIEYMVKEGADPVVKRAKDGVYPVHLAAHFGHVGALGALLRKAKSSWKLKDGTGKQPLHAAASRGHLAAVRALLARRISVDGRDKSGFQAIHWATDGGHAETVEMLIEQRVSIEARNADGETALHRAIVSGHQGLAQRLIDGRADVEASMKKGQAPVHSAAYLGHLGILELLHARGARLEPPPVKGQFSPEGLASAAGHKAALEYIRRHKGKDRDLLGMDMSEIAAVQSGHVPVLEQLIDKKPTIGPPAMHRLPLLHEGIHHGHLPVVEYLLDPGVLAEKELAAMLMHTAAAHGRAHIVDFLARKGLDVDAKRVHADKNATETEGDTPVISAAYGGHLAAVTKLAQLRADVNRHNAKELSAMHMAVMGGHAALVNALLDSGAKLSVGGAQNNSSGREHIHAVAAIGHVPVIRALLDRRSDVMAADAGGIVPMFLAAEQGHVSVLKFLTEQRADPGYKALLRNESDGGAVVGEATLLSIAAAQGHIPVLAHLLKGSSLDRLRQVKASLGGKHGEDWAGRFDEALGLGRRSKDAESWKAAHADPEKKKKMGELNEMFYKMQPHQRAHMLRRMEDEEARGLYEEEARAKRTTRPYGEL